MNRHGRRRLPLSIAVTACALFSLGAPSAQAVPSAPKILKTSVSAVKTDSATLKAEIDLGEKATSYRFEYGTEDCASNPCTATPEGQLLVAEGSPREVEVKLEGLDPETTYHFRVLAQNSQGKAEKAGREFTTYGLSIPFGPCPNDALRKENPSALLLEYSSANLPDCRAYEQASPVNKNGVDVTGVVGWLSASPNGDRISFNTTSSIPGGEGAQEELPAWLSSRDEGGWSTQGLYAPATAGDKVLIRGWTPDFSQVFEYANRYGPPLAAAFLSRSSEDRSLAEVVPYGEETHEFPSYVGASADDSLVVFESSTKLVPEAVEDASNVYLWQRDSGELGLVSVLPEDECEATPPCSPAAGAFAGAYDWISIQGPAIQGEKALDRGGAANSHYVQAQHALSADGDRVYFTAAKTGRLYVRLNPSEEQSLLDSEGNCTNPSLACTLHVSASQKENGKGPNGTDSAGRRPAAFMAASQDGSKVYFTSPEKLTDDATTGPEPDDIPTVYRAKANGEATSLEPEFLAKKAAGMTSDGTHLYWADPSTGSIGRAKLNEGAATEIEDEFIDRSQLEAQVEVETEPGVFETQGFAVPRYVTVDGEHIYWTNATDGEDGDGVIGRAKLNGEGPASEPEPEYIVGASNPTGIDVDPTSTFLYWGNAGGDEPTQTIGRAKLGAGGAEEVEQGFILTNLSLAAAEGIAVGATHIYAAVNRAFESYVFRYDIDGDPDSWTLRFDESHSGPGIRGIALDSGHVYWTRPWDETIGRIDLNLENPGREFIKEAGKPLGLALDAGHFYWSANQEVTPNLGNDLYRFDAETGALEDLTPDPSEENGAEVRGVLGASEDASTVYFAAAGVLAPGAAPGNCVSECNIYLHREGQALAFVARIVVSGVNDSNWQVRKPPSYDDQKTSRVAADGQTLLFRSPSKLTAYDNEGVAELYRYRIGEPGFDCVSCNPSGVAPGAAPQLGGIGPSFLYPPLTAAVLSRNLSADGNRVFFETADALLPQDVNGEGGCPKVGTERFSFPVCQDVYEWEAKGTGSCESEAHNGGCLYLLSSGKSSRASFFADASLSGDDAFIVTRSRLAGQDRDRLYDLYDASVDGGLASQNQLPPVPCEAEACKGATGTPPSGESAGSASFVGPPNPKGQKPKPRCPKGKRKARVKGKTRCLPRHERKRDAKTNRRKSR